MAAKAPYMAVAGTVLNMQGQRQAGAAAAEAGRARQQADQYQAAQLEQNAGQAIASSQRQAMEERRRAQLLVSRGIAVAAAGGGGVQDPTVTNIIGKIAEEGAYRAAVDLYQGEERARAMRMGAEAKMFEGEMAARGGEQRQSAYNTAALGSALKGASMFAKYGGGGPSEFPASDNTIAGWD